MAIDPKLVSIIPASQLPTGAPTNAADFLFYEGDALKKGSMSNIYDKVTSGIKGVATQTNAPTVYSAEAYPNGLTEIYRVFDPLTSPNSWGNIAVTQAELNANDIYFVVTNGVVVKSTSEKRVSDPTKIPLLSSLTYPINVGTQFIDNGKIYQVKTQLTTGQTPTTNPEKVENLGSEGIEFDTDEDLFLFQDSYDSTIGRVNQLGEFDILLTEATKERARITDNDSELILFKDSQENIVSSIDRDGYFVGKIKEKEDYPKPLNGFFVAGFETIKKKISLQSVAVGRASAEGVDDAVKVTLDGDGYTHPKVLYFENGFAGFKYWMAITPTFGLIAQQSAPAYFENPHIFCSNDGENFIEPVGISNPIDVTAPHSYTEAGYPFWSDTHLLMGDDGYLYCYYRGVSMPKAYLIEGETGLFDTVTVCKRSRDGVNWEKREVVFEHPNSGSQAFVNYKSRIICYDVVFNSVENPLPQGAIPNSPAVFRRTSIFPNKGFEPYDNSQIVKFKNNYLPANYGIWHLEAEYFEGVWLLLINAGVIGNSMGAHLYLAYSYDGWEFEMIKEPIYYNESYRSSLTPIKYENGVMEINLYRADTINGHTDLIKLYLNK